MGVVTEAKYMAEGLCLHYPPPSTFTVDQIPDLTGRVCLVTGGYAGIGKETTKALLNHNAKVYIASRSKTKAEAAIEELKTATGREAIFLQLDLADLAAIRRAAEEFLSKESALHVLFNNAGVMWCSKDLLTADGYDLQFGTNVIGHWYFTELLMPALFRGKASSPDGRARIITTSSASAYLSTLQWGTFKDGQARRKLSKYALYNQSKFANVVISCEIARKYGGKGILAISVNPGETKSELQRHTSGAQRWVLDHMLLDTPMGALTQLYAGTMPEALEFNGLYMAPFARVVKCRPEAYDPQEGAKLWNWMEEQVKDYPRQTSF